MSYIRLVKMKILFFLLVGVTCALAASSTDYGLDVKSVNEMLEDSMTENDSTVGAKVKTSTALSDDGDNDSTADAKVEISSTQSNNEESTTSENNAQVTGSQQELTIDWEKLQQLNQTLNQLSGSGVESIPIFSNIFKVMTAFNTNGLNDMKVSVAGNKYGNRRKPSIMMY